MKKYIKITSSAIFIIYLLLLIPDPAIEESKISETGSFAWDQDEYWSQLELIFQDALQMDSISVEKSIRIGLNDIHNILDSLDTQTIRPSSPILKRLEKSFFELSPLIAARTDYLSFLIHTRTRLRFLIKVSSYNWDMNSPDARNQIYRLLYGSRIAVEEIILQSEDNPIPALVISTNEPSTTPWAELKGVKVHSGDILVSRGGAPTSSLIARGNDYPGNFSHVALMHIDEESDGISIIESHIEYGVAIATAEKYLSDTKLRILILRLDSDHPAIIADPMLPHKAATFALNRSKSEHIPYDFEMDFSDNSKLFCSEVASDAYSQFGITLWMGISNISTPGVRSWLAAFGVKHFVTQEPSDLEYDPQLRVVAEWRGRETLYKDHLDNAVIDVMLEAAENGERLGYPWYKLPLGKVAKLYSMIKNIWHGVGPVPEGMSATSALKADQFSKRHDAIKEELVKHAEMFRKENGYNPPYWELVKLARQAKNSLKL